MTVSFTARDDLPAGVPVIRRDTGGDVAYYVDDALTAHDVCTLLEALEVHREVTTPAG